MSYVESCRNKNGKYKKFLDVRVTTEGHRMKIGWPIKGRTFGHALQMTAYSLIQKSPQTYHLLSMTMTEIIPELIVGHFWCVWCFMIRQVPNVEVSPWNNWTANIAHHFCANSLLLPSQLTGSTWIIFLAYLFLDETIQLVNHPPYYYYYYLHPPEYYYCLHNPIEKMKIKNKNQFHLLEIYYV